MKIILKGLTLTKTYEYELLTKKSTVNGVINYTGASITSNDNARTFIYDCSALKYVKVVCGSDKNSSAPYARFVDANDTLVGTKLNYTRGGETEFQVPSGAVEFQVTDTYSNKSNDVSVYGKRG